MSRVGEPPRRQPTLQAGGAITAARVKARMSPKELAGKTRISLSHICEVEKGYRSCSAEYLNRIADALGTEVTELLNPERLNASSTGRRAS